MSNKAGNTADNNKSRNPNKDLLSNDLRDAIRHMVINISKSFIVQWYTNISPTNHDFVASCELLIENALTKFAQLCVKKLDKYKTGQLVTSLLHDHILNDNVPEKTQSIEGQIDNHEYDICQNSVVRLFGLLCTDELRKVIFVQNLIPHDIATTSKRDSGNRKQSRQEEDDFPQVDNTNTTSALYTLVIAMLTKAVFMPIVDSISAPDWLYAVIIWLCKKEERDRMRRDRSAVANPSNQSENGDNNHTQSNIPDLSNIKPHETAITVTSPRGFRSLDLEDGLTYEKAYNFDLAPANINFDNPVCDSLKRPLDNIEIYATEEVKSNNSCYVLYCIRYDGLCHRHPSAGGYPFNFIPENSEVPIIDKRATSNSSRRNFSRGLGASTIDINYTEPSTRKSFRRRMTIKRRFREFVLLQLRLEENPKIRPYMKNIPKPTKLKAATQNIFSLPGITNIKLDQSTIKLRQRFLERFLTALNSSPFIANSYEFREFFSYNVNPATSNITKSKSLILQVNLNKVFVDSVRSAFSIIRSSLPGDDNHNLGSSNADPDAWLTELQQSTLKLHVQTRTSHSKMNLERYIDSKLLSLNPDSPTRFVKSSSLGRRLDYGGYMRQMDNLRGGSLRANLVHSNSLSSTTNSSSLLLSRSSSSNSRNIDGSSKSSSEESIYYDATNILVEGEDNYSNSIQICDSVPIASKFIDIMHYSISKDSSCSKSPINTMARLLLGKTIER